MLQKFFSGKDRIFIPLFEKLGKLIEQGGQELSALLSLNDSKLADVKCKTIDDLENEGDEYAREILKELYQTFFAPYDHEDIKDLTQALDDVLDEMDGAVHLKRLYQLDSHEPYVAEFGNLIAASTRHLCALIASMKNVEKCREYFDRIDALEHQSDTNLSKALFDLFKNQTDALTIIKYKEFYERLENVNDRVKSASDVIEGIVLKYT
ncbi:MAG: DUF47 family protein [Patescibacteria group bacterium]